MAISFIAAFLVQPVSADQRQRGDLVLGSRYIAARAVALGEAFIPLADDGPSALFYNPAAIARLHKMTAEPLNISLQANTDFFTSLNRQVYKFYSLDSYAPVLGGMPNRAPGGGFMYFPTFSMRGFAFGVLLQSRVHAAAVDSGKNIRYRSFYDLIPTAGTGIRLASGVVRIGYSFQWINHASGDITVPIDKRPIGYDLGLAEGAAFSHNVGFALTLPVQYLPAFNIVARNVMGAKFDKRPLYSFAENSTIRPKDEPMTLDASLSMEPKTGAGGKFNLAFQYRDITNQSGMLILGRLSLGVEFAFRNSFFLRVGWGSAYLDAGFGMRREKSDLSVSWYAEEFGNIYHDFGDRRIMLQYQYRAF
ncbi:MAG: hypothetical protein A2583_13260 [Bdellovibrionales bacterium RIFOXYD1_FULL_53_11]|nr:MAG: hypothetical protein A2583_13260 [Bdellovibrionales bacterium RIFOXYD1_FULL_53_11]